MQDRLDDRVFVVTGGASGMGAAMAMDFAARGAKLALFDLDDAKASSVAAAIRGAGGVAERYVVDVTNKASIERAAAAVELALGPITSWVNSAGVSRMMPFLDTTESVWDQTIDVNLKATFLGCQVAITHMLRHGGGVILNMSSLSGKKPSAWQTAYCASKFGVQGLTQSIAKEFADQRIRVNSICPGIVPTEMWDRLKVDYAKKRNIAPDEVMGYFTQAIPMHRLTEIQDVLNAAVFLMTDNSSYMTGQSINLNGGEWMD
ncbi:MAG: SDR family NAD(P)-dependent oxidoreductase [Propionicimonas sp.]